MAWQVEMFHDGDCPLCEREVQMLRRLDRGRGAIRFTDIASNSFVPEAYGGDRDYFMSRIRARTKDGIWLDGVDVFRALYDAVGFSWAVRASRAPVLRQLLDVAYDQFAKNRLRLTGRSDACGTYCEIETA